MKFADGILIVPSLRLSNVELWMYNLFGSLGPRRINHWQDFWTLIRPIGPDCVQKLSIDNTIPSRC